MQQVGAQAFSTATPVDPRYLPALVNAPGRQVLIKSGHLWVLHKRALLRGLAALVCLVALGGLYAARSHIQTGTASLGQLTQTELAKSPFAIKDIVISGQVLTNERTVLDALALTPSTSTVNFDVDAARAAIERLPSVAEASVRKVFPGRLVIKITEKTPVARWRVDGKTYLVDRTGFKIAEADARYAGLPLVVGDAAGNNADAMIRAVNRFPALKKGLVALSRIADRRWDMIYGTGLRVQLPELGVALALSELNQYQRDYQLLDRDVTKIDLRVPGLVALAPTEEAAKQLKAIAEAAKKRNSTHFKGDAEYQTPAQRAAQGNH